MAPNLPPALSGIEALVFDLMGTCTDWHTSILSAMREHPPPPPLKDADLPSLALDWRTAFFRFIFASFNAGEQAPDIDVVHARTLDELLREKGVSNEVWDTHVREKLVKAWHLQTAWPDSVEGIRRLKERCTVVVLANGTTRLQLDIIRSARLPFDTLFSSQILQATKPDPLIYRKALESLGLRSEQTAMVAAHAYDLRAAAKLGMKTVYIQRRTEDPDEDMKAVREDVDMFIDGAGRGGGLMELADMMGA
ncbi:haloacid dehalogenase [Laetiporus sulphureus 93-53]|uniref:Haloacid dehalogenase n=1 Tax=Laetiporus sulphureus 93-53 TaxID=1314785 RepID=A0A165HQE7_9APHY|nr:haloacid dehalogenase [Laetiporus sulphureus 93-53]KZT12049.1 haloacid dehalogenase [Laetiporus sulphureus 93-53]